MRAALILFLAFPALAAASEPDPPLTRDERDIMEKIQAGIVAHDQFEAVFKAANEAGKRGALGERLTKLMEAEQLWLERQRAFDDALGMMTGFYDIKPKGDTVKGGLVDGTTTYWKPKFYNDSAQFKRVEDKDGFPRYLRFKQVVAAAPGEKLKIQVAQTLDNGEVAVRLKGFEIAAMLGNPRYLASQVYHESVHYARLTSTGWGNGPLAWAEDEEAAAYEEELKKADDFHLTREQKQAIKEQWEEKKAAEKKTSAYTTQKDSNYNGGIYNDPQMQYHDQLAFIQGEIKELSERLRRDRERRERQAESDRRLRWIKLKDWFLYMCQYMRGTQYGDPEWGNPGEIARRDAAYREYVLTHYVVLPKEELDAGLRRSDELYADKLCQPWVIKMVGTIPGPTDAEWVVNKITTERGKPDAISRFIGAIARAVQDGTVAIVKTVAAPFVGERRPGGGGGGDSDRERPGRPPGGRIPDETPGKPYQQLRGIASETGEWD